MSEEPKPASLVPVKLPSAMPALRIRHYSPFGHLHLTVVLDLKAEREMEIFCQLGKSGAIMAADLEGICRLASLYLRAGGKFKDIIKQLKGIGSVLDGHLYTEQKGHATSVPDSLAQALQKYADARDKFGMKALVLGEAEILEEGGGDGQPTSPSGTQEEKA